MLTSFIIHRIKLTDTTMINKVNNLLLASNLQPDTIDNCLVICDDNNNVIATASSFLNTIKCLAIKSEFQGNNFANLLITHLIKDIYAKQWKEVFIFGKISYLPIFKQLGFEVIYQNNIFAFLTNRFDLFTDYLNYLKKVKENFKTSSAVVINANPFTKGHQYLVKTACENSDFTYIIPVKEENKFFSYHDRVNMIKAGVKSYKNVKVLEGSNYLVSKNVFPSYFLSSSQQSAEQQTNLDAQIFAHYIASCLDVKIRFVGEEPLSPITDDYNKMMAEILPKHDINLIIIKRLKIKQKIVSATQVRKYYQFNNWRQLKSLVPLTTYHYLQNLKKNHQK